MTHATWPDVAVMFLMMIFTLVCTLLAGIAEEGKRRRDKDQDD